MFVRSLTLVLLALALPGLFACQRGNDDEVAVQREVQTAVETAVEKTVAVDTAAQLNQLTEAYFEKNLALNPVTATIIGDDRYNDQFANSISPEYIEQVRALEQEYLDQVNALNAASLEGQDKLTYDAFKWDREMALEGLQYPSELLPFDQFASTPNFFAQMGSGESVHPFKTVKDYDDFLGRIDDFSAWMDQAVVNMKKGVAEGVVQPRILMERALPQLEAQIVDDPKESLFYRPITNLPGTFSAEDRDRLTEAYTAAITDKLVPAYRKVHDFVRDEYLPATTAEVGLSTQPNGAAWYAYLVRRTTTTNMSPDTIHQLGLREVERIHGEMEKVMDQVDFEGTLQEFFAHLNDSSEFYYDTPEQLVAGYRDLRDRVESGVPGLFAHTPKTNFEIRKVEPFRERSAAGGSYMRGSPDGSRAGVFYDNTYDIKARPKWAMENLFLHEAIPGHHFQIALQQENEDLPRYRRFARYTAYSEGWGLYAETLGQELGMYKDPYQYFGALNAELWRAVRLVVDTGLHAKGWSRQDVLDYMYANTAVKEARATAEAERYIAIPSQALAYKVGQLKIRELRDRAEQALGDAFDVRAFHDQILKDGALPLEVLSVKVDRWIANQLSMASQ